MNPLLPLGSLCAVLAVALISGRRQQRWRSIAAPIAILAPLIVAGSVYLAAAVDWQRRRAEFLRAEQPLMFDGREIHGKPVPGRGAVQYELPNGRTVTLGPPAYAESIDTPLTHILIVAGASIGLSLIAHAAGRAAAERWSKPEPVDQRN